MEKNIFFFLVFIGRVILLCGNRGSLKGLSLVEVTEIGYIGDFFVLIKRL